MSKGMLTLFCGKMGAGKTTMARQLAETGNVVLLSEDEWLAALYPGEVTSIENYVTFSNQLKPIVKKLVQSILLAGSDVVMDFPANTVSQRKWFKSIYAEITARHQLVYIDVSDSVCLEQIGKRRIEQPERAATDTEEMFKEMMKYFVEPVAAEGFEIRKVMSNG